MQICLRASALLLLFTLLGCGSETAQRPSPAEPTAIKSEPMPVGTTPVSVATAAPEPMPILSPEEISDGWITLFDGQTLFGWKAESKANWEAKNGVLSVSQGEPGLLCTTSTFDNYQLKLEFRAPEKSNSGIFLRTASVVGKEDVATKCYELNIAGADNPFPTGSLVMRAKAKEVPYVDDWRSYDVTVDGAKITVLLDGAEVVSYEDPNPLGSGFIGLQLNSGLVEFRNIKLKPLGLDSLFNGKDLSGWKEPAETQSKFSVTEEGWLNVKNGKGYLETEKSFGNFALQLQCISNADCLNSGVFFRCIPGETMNGYESQIQNCFKNDDRTQPADCGTGGIFRRINARRVIPNDKEWFTKTIIADGSHISVWVDGYQVTNWTDERPAHENPRNGLRTEAGTIQLQGHDPTTDLSFRNITARELNPR